MLDSSLPKLILKYYESDNTLDLYKKLRKIDIQTKISSIKMFHHDYFSGFEI